MSQSLLIKAPLVKHVLKNVTVIGGGLMGSGIAQVAAQTSHNVTLVDISESALKKSIDNIKKSLQRIGKKQFKDRASDLDDAIAEILAQIVTSTNVEESVKKANLVIEAIVENIDRKHELFKVLDKAAPHSTIFASNTSSLSIKEIASVTQRKDRFGGLHFFNPVPMMNLVEVVKTNDTSEESFELLLAFGQDLQKKAISCKDTPGFVVNRLIVPYMCEAEKMLERGDAKTEDIDAAMKLGAGYPMGPFELLDYVGLDTHLSVVERFHKKFPDNPLFEPSKLLKKLVSEGKLGRKTGEGFYKYKK